MSYRSNRSRVNSQGVRFLAIQTEKMSNLMKKIKINDDDLTKMIDMGIAGLRDHTGMTHNTMTHHTITHECVIELTPDEEKIDLAFRGIIDKFEAHSFIRQVRIISKGVMG